MSEKIKKLIFATGNKGKAVEVKNLFKNSGIEVLTLHDFDNVPEIIEDADTFEGNAFIKAEIIFNRFGLPVVADDSGLEVEQLNNEPGVYSARYAGENCTYDDNNVKLLKELADKSQPHSARFICCAVFFDGEKRIVSLGELKGEIIKEKRGEHGFGYDPIFKPEGENRCLAEMALEEKNKISHRATAFQNLKMRMAENEII